MAAPIFFNRFCTPDAFVCASFGSVAQEIFASGTIAIIIPRPNTKFGKAISTSDIDVLISPNRSPAEARTIKPTVTTGLIPTFETNSVYAERLNSMISSFITQVDLPTATHMAQAQIHNILRQQATLWGYVETFRYFAVAVILILPFVCFLHDSVKAEKKQKQA